MKAASPTDARAGLTPCRRLYHASRESFTYLREFYIGELYPDELSCVPRSGEEPSADFMQQLREFSRPFRHVYKPEEAIHKSF